MHLLEAHPVPAVTWGSQTGGVKVRARRKSKERRRRKKMRRKGGVKGKERRKKG